jgi:hypothetical protein
MPLLARSLPEADMLDVEEDEATSFRTSVFAKRTEFNWTRRRVCKVLNDTDHSCSITKRLFH